MSIEEPRHPIGHPDRSLECQESIEDMMKQVIDISNGRGWGTVETMDAMEEVLKNLRLAYAEDPDPAEG